MNDPSAFLDTPILQIGGNAFSLGAVLLASLGVLVAFCLLLARLALRSAASRRQATEEAARQEREAFPDPGALRVRMQEVLAVN